MTSAAALILAIAALITAAGGFITVLIKIGAVHTLVNNQLDRQLRYSQELTAALTRAGVAVPEQHQPGKP